MDQVDVNKTAQAQLTVVSVLNPDLLGLRILPPTDEQHQSLCGADFHLYVGLQSREVDQAVQLRGRRQRGPGAQLHSGHPTRC